MTYIRTRETAIMRLAKELHFKMEHLDPTENEEWDHLSDREVEFYRLCIEWLLLHPNDIYAAMGSPTTT